MNYTSEQGTISSQDWLDEEGRPVRETGRKRVDATYQQWFVTTETQRFLIAFPVEFDGVNVLGAALAAAEHMDEYAPSDDSEGTADAS